MDCPVNYEAVKAAVSQAGQSNGSQFMCEGYMFNIFTCRHTKATERPAFWKPGSALGDFDIYIGLDRIKKPFRKPVLLHETLEALVWRRLDRSDERQHAQADPGVIAHQIASELDIDYARELLEDELFTEYLLLKGALELFCQKEYR